MLHSITEMNAQSIFFLFFFLSLAMATSPSIHSSSGTQSTVSYTVNLEALLGVNYFPSEKFSLYVAFLCIQCYT